MHYLYKLNFSYGVHFGADKMGIGLEKISPNCHCDTLYSAIYHEILKLYGEDEANNFYLETRKGEFLFSDLLPYTSKELMIPKPIIYLDKDKSKDEEVSNSVKKKKMKKLQFIPILRIKDFFDKNIDEIKFNESITYEKNSPSRKGDSKENGLYSVGVTMFLDGCGLYFIVKMDESKKEWFDKVIVSLGLSGIGGKRTSGYGQFEIIDDFELDENSHISEEAELTKMLNRKGEYYLTLSAFYPDKEEILKLKEGYYSIIQRKGFIQSNTYSKKPLKKLPSCMINAGSCFKNKFNGTIYDVSLNGTHSVYRYGKPIMIGIEV